MRPIYTKFDQPSGRPREQMKKHNLFRNSGYSGGFLPILDEPSKGFESCLGSIYYRNAAIRDTLNALQKRPRHNLKSSLVSAYVRRTDAAFAGDPALQTSLDDVRDLLLTSEARKAINMLDVPEDELHRGRASAYVDQRARAVSSTMPVAFPASNWLPNLTATLFHSFVGLNITSPTRACPHDVLSIGWASPTKTTLR